MSSNAELIAADRASIFHSWSAQRYVDPTPIAGGAGCMFWDHDGTKWLDFASQLIYLNLGHQHPALIAAIVDQARRLCTIAPSFANETRTSAASAILRHLPPQFSRIFFTNGGADANEHALRMARIHTGRRKVLAAYRSYHGATAGAATLTGDPRRWPSEPGIPGVIHFFGPYLYRSSFHATTEEEECERALAHLADVICLEGPDQIAAIILEPIVGTNGVLIPPLGYLAGVRSLCDDAGILLIADEVMVGFGRTGRWFGFQHWDVVPDLVTFAKGVNSGYVPLGGIAISAEVASTFDSRSYPGGLTYSGHPLACAAAVATIQVLEQDGIVERVDRLGTEVFAPGLRGLQAKHPSVGDIRGLGCFWALELVRDRSSREMLVPFNAQGVLAEPMTRVVAEIRRRGVWPFAHFNRIHLAPPLIVTREEIELALQVIDEALEVADELVVPC